MTSRPNILLICTDQHRYDVLSVYGNTSVRTPNLQALADAGVVFEHCYSPNPVCAPARASMITGRYPHSHGLWANGVTLPADEVMASRLLADAGYHCGIIGKIHLSPCFQGRTERRLDDGFQHVRWAHDPFHGSPENAYHAWLRRRFPDRWEQSRTDVVTPDRHYLAETTAFDTMPTEAHYSTWVAEETEAFLIGRDREEPFFLWVNFYDPHHPFVAPPEYLDLYPPGSVPPPVGREEELADKPAIQAEASRESYAGKAPGYTTYSPEEIDEIRRSYYAMVTAADEMIGKVLASLEASGDAENTLVIFTSDHGEMLGDHALLLKGPMMYDCAVRVPLIMRWPNVLPSGRRRTEMAGLHDVAPTILAAAGVEAPQTNQGLDLCRVALDEVAGRTWALSEYRDSGHPYDPPVFTSMIRTYEHKLVVWHGDPATGRPREGELYDLRSDPDELYNLWDSGAHQSVKADLFHLLLDAYASTEDRPSREAAW